MHRRSIYKCNGVAFQCSYVLKSKFGPLGRHRVRAFLTGTCARAPVLVYRVPWGGDLRWVERVYPFVRLWVQRIMPPLFALASPEKIRKEQPTTNGPAAHIHAVNPNQNGSQKERKKETRKIKKKKRKVYVYILHPSFT